MIAGCDDEADRVSARPSWLGWLRPDKLRRRAGRGEIDGGYGPEGGSRPPAGSAKPVSCRCLMSAACRTAASSGGTPPALQRWPGQFGQLHANLTPLDLGNAQLLAQVCIVRPARMSRTAQVQRHMSNEIRFFRPAAALGPPAVTRAGAVTREQLVARLVLGQVGLISRNQAGSRREFALFVPLARIRVAHPQHGLGRVRQVHVIGHQPQAFAFLMPV